jgi:hypothetical protein
MICARPSRVPEKFLHAAAALLQPVERQAEIGHRVPDRVVGLVAVEPDQHGPLEGARLQAAPGEFGQQPVRALVHLDQQHLADLGHAGDRVGAQQTARLDRHQVVADPLDLAQQVRGDHDRHAELGTDPGDQLQHRVAARRVEPDGRLVEQQHPGVADQRLGQLDPLLHAGRVGADLPVPLLVQPDVPQRLRGPLLGRGRRQPGHPAQVRDELGGGDVGGQAVVLGHISGQRPDLLAVPLAVRAEHPGLAAGGLEQAEQDLD